MCCYLNFFSDFSWSVSSSKLNWLIFFGKCTLSDFHSICACTKSDEKYVLQWLYACALCACRYLHLQKENFNTVISSLDERYIFDQDLHWCKSILRISSEEMLIRKSAAGVLRFCKRNCFLSDGSAIIPSISGTYNFMFIVQRSWAEPLSSRTLVHSTSVKVVLSTKIKFPKKIEVFSYYDEKMQFTIIIKKLIILQFCE